MAELGELVVRLRADMNQFESAMGNVGNKLKNVSSSLTGIGTKMTDSVTRPIIGFGIEAMKASADFETGMNKVKALTGATGNQFNMMREQAKELGASTEFSASQAADAMGFLGMAGMKANEIYDAMPGTLQLASAAQMDLGQSADIVSNILTAYGMSAKDLGRVNDVLVKGFTSTNIDLSMLAESMKYAAPVAKGLGIEIENLTAMIGLMGNAGIQGSDAGTALRAGLTRLIKPPKDAAASLKELNIATTTAKGEMLPIVDILGDLEKSFVGMGNAEREAHMAKIFGLQHGSKWSAMMAQGNDKLKEQIKLLQNSGGAAKEVADVQMQGLNGAIKALKSAFEGLMIAIGDTGLLTDITNLAKKLTEFVQGLTKTNPTIMKFAMMFALVVAAIGPLLVVAGTLIGAIGTIASAIATIGAPIAIAIAAITTLVTALGGGAAAVKLGFIDLGSSTQIVQEKFIAFKEKAIEIFNNFKDLALTVFTFFKEQILPVLTEGFKEILPIIQDIMSGTMEIIGSFVEYAKFAFGVLAPYVKTSWELLIQIIKGALSIIQGVINVVMGVIQGDWSRIWEGITQITKGIFDIITGIIQNFINAIKANIVLGFEATKQGISDKYNEIIEATQSKLTEWGTAISTWFVGMIETIATKLTEWETAINAWFLEMPSKLGEQLGLWWESIVTWFESVPGKITEKLIEWGTAISTWYDEQKENITTKLETWWDTIKEWFTSIPGKIVTQLVEWGTAITKWTEEQNEENKRQFGLWWDAIKEWFTSIPSKITTQLVEWWTAFGKWFDEKKNTITTKLETWWTAFKTWMVALPGKITAKLVEWWTAFGKWFDEKKKAITDKLDTWWTAFKTWLDELPGKITTKLTKTWEDMKKSFDNGKKAITDKLNEWWTSIKKWFEDLGKKDEIKNAGKEIVKTLTKGSKEEEPDMMEKIGKLIIKVLAGALVVAAVALIATGRELIKYIIKGIQEAKASLQKKVEEIKTTIVEKISKLGEQAFTWGANIVGGIIDGLKSKLEGVKTAASNVATAISDFLQHKSPAKKGPGSTSDKWMPNLMKMLIKGINDAIPEFRSVTESLAQVIYDGFRQVSEVEKMFDDIRSKVNETWDKTIQDTKKQMNDLGNAIYTALKAQYDDELLFEEQKATARLDKIVKAKEKEIEEIKESAEKAIEAEKKAGEKRLKYLENTSDEAIKLFEREANEKLRLLDEDTYNRVQSLQKQIDAIEDQKKEEERLEKERERQAKLSELIRATATYNSLEEKEKAEKEYKDYLAKIEQEKAEEARKAKIEDLKNRIELVKKEGDKQKSILQEQLAAEKTAKQAFAQQQLEMTKAYNQQQLDDIKVNSENKIAIKQYEIDDEKKRTNEYLEFYKSYTARMKEEDKLYAEAKLLLMQKNQGKLVELLKTYYPNWQNAGQSFADKFMDGFRSIHSSMATEINRVMASVQTGMGVNIGAINNSISAIESTWQSTVDNMTRNSLKWQQSQDSMNNQIKAIENKLKADTKAIKDKLAADKKATTGKGAAEKDAALDKTATARIAALEKEAASKIKQLQANFSNSTKGLEQQNKQLANTLGLSSRDGAWYLPTGQQAYDTSKLTDQQIQSLMAGGSSNINLAVNIDGKKVATAIAPHLVNQAKMQGVK